MKSRWKNSLKRNGLALFSCLQLWFDEKNNVKFFSVFFRNFASESRWKKWKWQILIRFFQVFKLTIIVVEPMPTMANIKWIWNLTLLVSWTPMPVLEPASSQFQAFFDLQWIFKSTPLATKFFWFFKLSSPETCKKRQNDAISVIIMFVLVTM